VRALAFDSFGGPEVLAIRDLPVPELGPGTALVRTRAIGVNFADVYRRRGNYTIHGAPPYVLGYEGAGEIVEVHGESRFSPGDRVGFADVPRANAELVLCPTSHLVPLPPAIDFETAAAALLQGLTAQYLVRDSHRLAAGERVIVHAAAGGVGLLLVQVARSYGACVFGLTSSPRKAEHAKSAGADVVCSYDEDWVARAREWTNGRGVDVVYDSVGKTLDDSLRAARVGGHVVFYGMAGGDPAPVDPRRLMDESKSLTGGDLWNVLVTSEERSARAAELFEWITSGRVTITISTRFPLADGASAHLLLESRESVGKILLIA
jgi:NADPH2:quinone reductase